jgi:hypothetical protein
MLHARLWDPCASPQRPWVMQPVNACCPANLTSVHVTTKRFTLLQIERLDLALALQSLDLRLPVEFRLKAQKLSRLFDADQPFSRVVRLGGVWDVREDLFGELRSGLCVRNIGISNVEHMSAFEGLLNRQSEALGAIPGVDVAESAVHQ